MEVIPPDTSKEWVGFDFSCIIGVHPIARDIFVLRTH